MLESVREFFKNAVEKSWDAYVKNPTPPAYSGPFVAHLLPSSQGGAPEKTVASSSAEIDECYGDVVFMPKACSDLVSKPHQPTTDTAYKRGVLIQSLARMTP